MKNVVTCVTCVIDTEKTGERIIKEQYFIYVQYSLTDRKVIVISVICPAHFSGSFKSVLDNKHKLCRRHRKKKRKTDWILRLLSFNIKNLLYFSLILPLLFFEGQIREAGTQLFMKPFNIPQILSRLSLSKKDVGFFENFLYFSFAFLDKTLCKF